MSNRITTTPHNPATPRDAILGVPAPASRRWGARRRALVASLVVLVVILSVAGVFAWRIISALLDSQGSAIVPLPTRSSDVVFVRSTATPDADGTATPAATVTPRVTNIVAVDASPETEDDATAESSPVGASAPTPEASPFIEPTADASTSTEQTPLATSAELSRLDIVQEIVNASMRNGDPGRSSVWQGKTEINILVLGVDRRPDGGDQNSDVIIIAKVDLLTSTVSAVSLPRDLLVDVPGVYNGKINGTYNAGVADNPDDKTAGIVMVRDTIEALYGVPIDGYVLIDFDGFEEVVDAVGGIDVNVPAAIVDEDYPTIDYGTERVEFSAGLEHMNGDRALKYVRTRNTDSDDARRERQINVLLALFDQGRGIDSIRSGDEIIVALSDTVQTNLGLEQQLTLARIAREMNRTDITLTTLEAPLITGGYTEGGAWVYFSDPAAVAAFINDTLDSGGDPLTT